MHRGCSRAECFLPALAGPAFWRNDQTIVLDAQLDRIQSALLDERLRNANTAVIADTNQLGSHRLRYLCNYIVNHARRPFPQVPGPGLTVGVSGDAAGKLYFVQVEQPQQAQLDARTVIQSGPCPSELRVAQSGRVTCFAAGTMGPGAHGVMPMPPMGAENSHGGLGLPPSGPNPHAGKTAAPPPEKN